MRKYSLAEIADMKKGNWIVIHIPTIDDYRKLKEVCPAKFNSYSPKYKYYLNQGGVSDTSTYYENNYYVILEMDDIIFDTSNPTYTLI